MDRHVMVAPVGDNSDALFIGLREFPTQKLILVCPEGYGKEGERLLKDLQRFKVPVQLARIRGNLWEEMFKLVAEIKRTEGAGVIINTSSGDRLLQCAATSAAFVNGIKAFAVDDGQAMLLPVLKFNYYRLLSEKKMGLLRLLQAQPDCCASLEQLGRRTGMSLPLVSYHINGSKKTEGLREMGLIEATERKGRTEVRLSMLGRLLLKGYIELPRE